MRTSTLNGTRAMDEDDPALDVGGSDIEVRHVRWRTGPLTEMSRRHVRDFIELDVADHHEATSLGSVVGLHVTGQRVARHRLDRGDRTIDGSRVGNVGCEVGRPGRIGRQRARIHLPLTDRRELLIEGAPHLVFRERGLTHGFCHDRERLGEPVREAGHSDRRALPSGARGQARADPLQ